MRTALTLLYAVCLLAGVAHASEDEAAQTAEQASAPQAAQDATLDVAAILANPLTEDDYRETRNCLRMRDIDDVEVLDDNVVLFHGRRRELWLNQLSSQCLAWKPIWSSICTVSVARFAAWTGFAAANASNRWWQSRRSAGSAPSRP